MRNLARKDWYGVLSLPYGASTAAIKRRYRDLAKRLHPDVNRASDATARFRAISEAYQVLMDPELKSVVDGWYEARRPRRSAGAGNRVEFDVRARTRDLVSSKPMRSREARVHTSAIVCVAFFAFAAALVGGALVDLSFADQIGASTTVALFSALLAACDRDRTRELAVWLTDLS